MLSVAVYTPSRRCILASLSPNAEIENAPYTARAQACSIAYLSQAIMFDARGSTHSRLPLATHPCVQSQALQLPPQSRRYPDAVIMHHWRENLLRTRLEMRVHFWAIYSSVFALFFIVILPYRCRAYTRTDRTIRGWRKASKLDVSSVWL